MTAGDDRGSYEKRERTGKRNKEARRRGEREIRGE